HGAGVRWQEPVRPRDDEGAWLHLLRHRPPCGEVGAEYLGADDCPPVTQPAEESGQSRTFAVADACDTIFQKKSDTEDVTTKVAKVAKKGCAKSIVFSLRVLRSHLVSGRWCDTNSPLGLGQGLSHKNNECTVFGFARFNAEKRRKTES